VLKHEKKKKHLTPNRERTAQTQTPMKLGKLHKTTWVTKQLFWGTKT